MTDTRRSFSIRTHFALVFIALMAGAIIMSLIFNTLFLGEYYLKKKQSIIYKAYQTICVAAEQDSYGTPEFVKELEEVCVTYNITIYVEDSDSMTKYVSQNGGRQLEKKLFGYKWGLFDETRRVLDSRDEYIIQITGKGSEESLEMYGQLDTGVYFILQTPLQSIRESASMANRFMGYVGMSFALLGGIFIWLATWRITKPLAQLVEISEQMVHLNFEAKYTRKRSGLLKLRDEFDVLGENINRVSASLEHSISNLKTANNELRRDIERKEKDDEMRSEFLANVSHELKTPIALIQGYAEGLQEGVIDDPESIAYYCEVIVDEAAKMNNMVKKIMTLNELEFGNDVVSMERFDLVTLIENYIQSAKIMTQQQDIEVKFSKPDPIYVWADELKTEEVFMNFFTNAVNHCEGENVIEVTLNKDDTHVRVEVFNSGKPIPEESLSRIWDKFYKVDKARTREYGGNGVGLSIVKAIMESMHQSYGVENRENGVVFWFALELVWELRETK